MQSELKEALKIAQEQKLQYSEMQETVKQANIQKGTNFRKSAPSQTVITEKQPEANVQVAYNDIQQKLCAYSSSEHEETLSPAWSASSSGRDRRSIHPNASPLKTVETVERLESADKTTSISSFNDYESGSMNSLESDDLNDSLTSASEIGNVNLRSSPDSPVNSTSCSSHDTWLAETPVGRTFNEFLPKNSPGEYSKRQFSEMSASESCKISLPNYLSPASQNSLLFCKSSELQKNSPGNIMDVNHNGSFSRFHINTPCMRGKRQVSDRIDFNVFKDHNRENSSPQKINFFAQSPVQEKESTSFFSHEKCNDPPEYLLPNPKIHYSDESAHRIKRLNDITNFDSFSPILGSTNYSPLKKRNLDWKSDSPSMFTAKDSASILQRDVPSPQQAKGPKLIVDKTDLTRAWEEKLSRLQKNMEPSKSNNRTQVKMAENVIKPSAHFAELKAPLNSLQSIMQSYDFSDSDTDSN